MKKYELIYVDDKKKAKNTITILAKNITELYKILEKSPDINHIIDIKEKEEKDEK